jgi:hypothetical protein
MDTEFIHGRTEIGMKANGKIALNMDRGQIYLQMVTLSQVFINKVNLMDSANTSGRMEVFT